MGNFTIFQMFENPRRVMVVNLYSAFSINIFKCALQARDARNFTTNVPKIIDLKSSSEQIFSEN